jgi:hypothetical protein
MNESIITQSIVYADILTVIASCKIDSLSKMALGKLLNTIESDKLNTIDIVNYFNDVINNKTNAFDDKSIQLSYDHAVQFMINLDWYILMKYA